MADSEQVVGSEDYEDVSFTAIRYSDAKTVIGKIKPDNSIVIESEQSSGYIYNLIPLN